MTERGTLAGIDAARALAFHAAESERFAAARPRSRALAADLAQGFYDGVPMHWMRDWPTPFPLHVERAEGATIADVDGHSLSDFCLGDTGSMFGHSPEPVARAIREQAGRGLTYMLPTPAAAGIGSRLAARFGLPHWQIATTATDANRFALRVARAVTGRRKILVFQGCYHGAVEETFLRLHEGQPILRPGVLGQDRDLTQTSVVVEFNDVEALRAALSARDIACVITEPVLTNCAMVMPEPGFLDAVRSLTREAGTLLLIDETHTISTGPGGYTRRFGLDPDIFVCGKPVAGGVPASIWGFTDAIARDLTRVRTENPGYSGMGTTLSANALALAAMRATLDEVMTEAAYGHTERLAAQLDAGLSAAIAERALPWHVARIGARIEFIFAPKPLRNGTEAEATHIGALERAVHLGLLNRGVLIAPFHNMMLICPATTRADVERLVAAFRDVLTELTQ